MGKEIEKKLVGRLVEIARQLQNLADEISGISEIPPDLQKRFEDFRTAHVCLNCGKSLGKEKGRRGCHSNCYVSLMQRVSRGKASDKQLVLEGRMRPPETAGRKPDSLPPIPQLPDSDEATMNQLDAKIRKKAVEISKERAKGKREKVASAEAKSIARSETE